jgi:hypothetical protein
MPSVEMNAAVGSGVDSFLVESVRKINAQSALKTFSSCFTWADHRIRIVLVGIENTGFFTDAIYHRLTEEETGPEELVIYVVDDSVAGFVLPTPFWKEGDFDAYGRMQEIGEDYFVEYASDNQVLVVLGRKVGIGVIWVRNVASLPEWERSFPFRNVLYQWFKNSRLMFVHAGAVGDQNGGVLLTGKGGMGKSTATLACLDSELRYAGDDFVMIDTETLEVHSLYNVAKLEASNLHRFPALAPFIVNPESLPQDKGQLFLHFFKPHSLIHTFKLKAIFLPRFTGRENTSIRQATKGDALLALAPSTIGLLKADTQMMARIAGLIQKLPCFWIETGTKLEQIPSSISYWLNTQSDD